MTLTIVARNGSAFVTDLGECPRAIFHASGDEVSIPRYAVWETNSYDFSINVVHTTPDLSDALDYLGATL